MNLNNLNEIKEFNYQMKEEIKSESKHKGKELLNKFPASLDKEKVDENGAEILGETNKFFEKVKEAYKFIKLLEQLELTEYINIPRICSIDNQNNGKTSILTNIIGLYYTKRRRHHWN